MVIPCLCLLTALRTLVAELVGAKPLHLLTQTVLLLKHPTGVFVAVANAKPPINKKRTRTLSRKESGSGTNCMVDGYRDSNPMTSCASCRCSNQLS